MHMNVIQIYNVVLFFLIFKLKQGAKPFVSENKMKALIIVLKKTPSHENAGRYIVSSIWHRYYLFTPLVHSEFLYS